MARISWVELSQYLRHTLLRDADQMSMAVSLEMRVPYLDHRLIEYVLSLPEIVKKQYKGRKGLLISAFAEHTSKFPPPRRKQGFELPMERWIKGPLARFTADGIEQIRARGVLSGAFLQEVQNRFDSGKLHWTRMWGLVVLGHSLARVDETVRSAIA
jgi:asparagine synthase (glutamine-hydrolysing)